MEDRMSSKMTPREYLQFKDYMVDIILLHLPETSCDVLCDPKECEHCRNLDEIGLSLEPPKGYFTPEEYKEYRRLLSEDVEQMEMRKDILIDRLIEMEGER